MSDGALSNPAAVQERLEAIDQRLSQLENGYEEAALAWFRKKRDREHRWAHVYVTTDGPAYLRKAAADGATLDEGLEAEAAYEGKKAVIRMLETRASIGQSILRAQSRV
jgi:hypothetical protein